MDTLTLRSDELLAELSMSRSLPELGETLERLARELSGCPRAFYYAYELVDNTLTRLQESAQLPAGDDTLPGRCAVRWHEVAGSGPPFDDAPGLAVPALLGGSLVGVLAVGGAAVSAEGAERARALARLAGLAHDFVGTRADLANVLTHTQALLVNGVEGVVGRGHVGLVARIASELGLLLDLSIRAREQLWQAASYHDLGWLMLQGDARFDDDRHVQAGVEFLSKVRPLRHLAPLVAASHERWDGSGFPNALSGEQVTLEGWILALAEDVTEQVEAARDEATLQRTLAAFFETRAGKHHPAVLDALSGLIDSGRFEEVVGKPIR